jgi:hypothetical protein
MLTEHSNHKPTLEELTNPLLLEATLIINREDVFVVMHCRILLGARVSGEALFLL